MLSIVIPYRGNTIIRIENLQETLRCVHEQTYKDYEIILVEEKSDSYCNVDFPVDLHIRMENTLEGFEGVWNEGWAYNVGARQAKGDRLLFLGADYLFDKDYLSKLMECTLKGFLGWDVCYALNEKGREAYIARHNFKEVEQEEYVWRKKPSHPGCSCGGAFVFDRDFFWDELGGFSENFFGWGKLDNETANRLIHITGTFKALKLPVYHLWHPKEEDMKLYDFSMNTLVFTVRNQAKMSQMLKDAKLGDIKNPIVVKV